LAWIALLTAALLLAFAARQGWNAVSLGLLLLLPVVIGAAFKGLRRTPKGSLHWDGERWHWAGENAAPVTSLVCVLDLQDLMLLHVRVAQHSVLWLWMQKDAHAGRWLALRRALALGPNPSGVEADAHQL
jgi:hypothetical protein